MRKAAFYLLALGVIVAGLVVGTLNAGNADLDLLWFQLDLPLGLALLLAFSAGVVTALVLFYLARVLPLKLQLRRARSELKQRDSHTLPSTDD